MSIIKFNKYGHPFCNKCGSIKITMTWYKNKNKVYTIAHCKKCGYTIEGI